MKSGTALVWLRRDLRLDDNAALYYACRENARVCAAFVLNPPLLAEERMGAPLVNVFFDALAHLRAALRERGSDLVLLEGDFQTELLALARRIGAEALYFNEDYEPYAVARDRAITGAFENAGHAVQAYTDHVYFGAGEVLRPDGTPYRMFTPYKRRWLEQRAVSRRLPFPSRSACSGKMIAREDLGESRSLPTPQEYGYAPFPLPEPASERAAHARLDAFLEGGAAGRYSVDRNVPAIEGTSRLSMHLRAGTIGIRTCVEAAIARPGAEKWIDELVWRDFYQMIYRNFPHVAHEPFIAAAARIVWNEPGDAFDRWCAGMTGYPIVDAGMRQLNETGWMHNRLRMIVASFLTKHLLVDWRLGERYFERRLIDADPAQNNGGWQWAASTGTDAVPYFRIFNPLSQAKQFDPGGVFIKRYVPEIGTPAYPPQIVEHSAARARALAVYGNALRGDPGDRRTG